MYVPNAFCLFLDVMQSSITILRSALKDLVFVELDVVDVFAGYVGDLFIYLFI
jgi:hypothetical protein